jgi:hypothetical protein
MTLSIELEVASKLRHPYCVSPVRYVVVSVNEAPAPYSSHTISHLPLLFSFHNPNSNHSPQPSYHLNPRKKPTSNPPQKQTKPNHHVVQARRRLHPRRRRQRQHLRLPRHIAHPLSRKTRLRSTTPLTPLLLILMSNWVSRLSHLTSPHLPYLLSSLPSHLTPVPSVRTLGRKRVKKRNQLMC